LRDCSRQAGIVLDPFLGPGTTVIAAEHTGRRARGIEIDPVYVDVAVKRWQDYSGKTATLVATGETFEEVAQARATSEAADALTYHARSSDIGEAA
jgi:DNA modification methylase